jgi:beta-lactamase regulating signal transducer with metallopeptidase domain/predicted deacylase
MSIDPLNSVSAWILEGLFRASWQGGIAVLLVWGASALVPRLPAAVKSWLWRLVFLKMLLAFLWVRPIELMVLAPDEDLSPSFASSPLVQAAAVQYLDSSATDPGADAGTGTAGMPDAAKEPVTVTTAFSIWTWREHWKLPVAALWLCGVLAGCGVIARQFLRARELRASVSRCTDESIRPLLIALARALGLIRLPQIYTSTVVTRPLLIGILRPALIFPEALVTTASPESLRMMIAHELAHIRRGDLAWTAFAAFVRTIFFFHPLVWLARREALLAQEIACDQLAMEVTSSAAPRYAEMLLDVVAMPASRPAALISLSVAENGKTLERRIRHMKFIGHQKSKAIQCVAAVALFAALIMLIPIRLVAAPREISVVRPEHSPAQQIQTTFAPRESETPFVSGAEADSGNAGPRDTLAPGAAARLLEEIRGKDRSELRQIMPTLLRDRLLDRYLRDLSQAEQKGAALQGDYSEDHPEVKRVQALKERIEGQIEARLDGILAGLQAKAEADARSSEDFKQAQRQAVANASAPQSERELLELEIQQLRNEAETAAALAREGRQSATEAFEAKRNLLDAERELALLNGDRDGARKAIDQIVEELQKIIAAQEELRQQRLVPASSVSKLRRDLWRLQREKLALDRANPSAPSEPQPQSEAGAPGRSIAVHGGIGGMVQQVLVKTGDAVKKGDPLLQLDPTSAQSRLSSSEIRARIAQADLDIAKSEFIQTEKEHRDRLKLIEVGREPVGTPPPNVDGARAKVTKAEAQLELARLDIAQAQAQLERCTLRAPVDGVVTFVIHEGYWVPQEGGKILAEIHTNLAADRTQRLKDALAKLKQQEAELLTKYKSGHPQLREVRGQIRGMEAMIQAREGEAKGVQ